ncbi:hypothetical protein [Candidatus Endomicrobiellum trichonymphae]|uniref:hypothetical protein n=1 Tax=Endomicrobium trichonymphae TaxID=1408204 RepID=UPI001555BB2E|nr:hypothetical protein [Candidatus Endomicrobium trichonymphae]
MQLCVECGFEGTIKTENVGVGIDDKIKCDMMLVVGDIKTDILTIAEETYFYGKSSIITKEYR